MEEGKYTFPHGLKIILGGWEFSALKKKSGGEVLSVISDGT